MGVFELFDLGLEGTTVGDCLRLRSEGTTNAIVFDACGAYGSTFPGYSGICSSKYVRSCSLNRGRGDAKILLEAFPAVFRPADELLPELRQAGMMELVEFIKIEQHLYIDASGKAYKIPHSKTEVADSDVLSLLEKSLVGKLLRGRMSFEEFSGSLSSEARQVLVCGIAGGAENKGWRMARYARNFGNVPFLYPRHGIKEISEMFSRCNSMCGVGYVLDPDLKVTERSEATEHMFCQEQEDGGPIPPEYLHRIDTSYGVIFTKRLVRAEHQERAVHVRAINTRKAIFGKTFFAVVQGEAPMKVIGLNSDSECCPEGTYLIYVIRTDRPASEEDLALLQIDGEDVIEDISYQTRFWFEPDLLGMDSPKAQKGAGA